jgi:hypothetical protein
MDPRFVASSKILFDQVWNGGEAGTRPYTAAELDAIADFSWPWEGLQRVVVAGLHAIGGLGDHVRGRRHVALAPPRAPQLSEG